MEKSPNDDRDRYRYGGGDRYPPAEALPTSLFVGRLALETSAETIHSEFGRFGPIVDVYLPKEFPSGRPKGYGFVKFQNGEDAKMAKEHLNHRVINGQEISIEYSDDSNRKKPNQMVAFSSRTRKGDGIRDSEPSQRQRSVP